LCFTSSSDSDEETVWTSLGFLVVWVAVFQGNKLPVSSAGCLNYTRLLQNSMCTYLFDVSAERNSFNAFGIDSEVMKLRGVGFGME
jgi:hypothetical protein